MPEYWEEIYHRGLQSIAVWNAFAPAFAFGEVTRAGHTTDVNDLQAKANEKDVQQDAVDVARLDRDGNSNFMADLCIRFPRKLEGDLAPKDPLHSEISDLRAINPDSPDNIAARARRTVSLWLRINAIRAAQVPAAPDFMIGSSVVADLQDALAAQGGLLQGVESERSKLAQKREALRALAGKVDDNNKRWFAAWEGEFADGSAERNALSQIDTGPQTPAPSALEIASAVPAGAGKVAVTYTPGGGKHGTSFKLLWKVEGVDADFVHDALLNLAGQTVNGGFASGQSINFKARATNSTGSTDGAVKTVVMP